MEATVAAEKPGGSPTMAELPYVDVRETHTGVVVLAGDRAYKGKKPVLSDFLDFRSVEQRERACRREVELNSRMSPESYRGVAHLDDPAGGPAEPVVVMRRYHDHDRLAFKVTRGQSGIEGLLDTIAGMLARFHTRAERSRSIADQGQPGAIDRRWRENLSELDRYARMKVPGVSGEGIERIGYLAAEFAVGRGALFARRIEEGCVVDGHGDLLADDIFCPDGKVALLDCLEFDDQLRYVDRIDDAAFLAMDLEFLGRKDLGDYFLQRYANHSADAAPSSLRDFYIAYRAVVRAKVDCVRFVQGKSEAEADAARHLGIATRHLESGAVRLALVGGDPGTGKSTLSRALAEKVGAQVISTDDLRRDLVDSGALDGNAGVLDAGLYSPANVNAVYEVVLQRARIALSGGLSVILDGTWRDPRIRAEARRIASETRSALLELMCTTTADTAADRIRTRPPGSSEVTPEIAATLATQQATQHTGWVTAHRINTSRPLEDSVRQAQEIWCGAA